MSDPQPTEPEEICSDFIPGGSQIAPDVYCKRCGYRREDHEGEFDKLEASLARLRTAVQALSEKWEVEAKAALKEEPAGWLDQTIETNRALNSQRALSLSFCAHALRAALTETAQP